MLTSQGPRRTAKGTSTKLLTTSQCSLTLSKSKGTGMMASAESGSRSCKAAARGLSPWLLLNLLLSLSRPVSATNSWSR